MTEYLITQQFEPCRMLDKVTAPDGYGGFVKTWQEGAEFNAYCRLDNEPEMRIAEAQGVKSVFPIVTPAAVVLQYHEVFRRERDGKIFRVTSDGDDYELPSVSTVKVRTVTAEEWEIPGDE